ncbi:MULTISPECIES: hypothetical protein [Enterococcus]|uniref:Uncharacterized protein n=1 Tax=Enterococcus canintestini TaxID=317010 RepID=A0A267HQZ4_9ENTE|nr:MULTISPECIES: hypothetical protein [Enterococcus]PAB00756.1 hypothetical protein AKL21_05740 [Enterococcus canintestini]WCG32204.1 hypothetical protein PML78_08335 [Enterococcus dispar]
MNHLMKKQFVPSNNGNFANYKDVQQLLKLESDQGEFGQSIKDTVDWIPEGQKCNIKGSKELLNLYEAIDAEKMDFVLPLSEIEFVGFYHDNEIILNLDGLQARGEYSFTSSFLDSLFSLKKFALFCLQNGEKDMLNENIHKLMISQQNERRQYRVIMNGEDLLLRGLTTTAYKNYDNNIALYLALQSLHKYSEDNKVNIFVESGYIADSELAITFIQKEVIKIDRDTFVEIGIKLTNNEITEGKLSLEFIYRVFDSDNNSFKAIGDTVVGIIHTYQVPTIQGKLKGLANLSIYAQETIEHIQSIKNRKNLDRDQLALIFSRLSRAKSNEISKQSKERIESLYQQEVVNNTYSLVELFGKIDALGTSIDEKTFIHLVFNDLIKYSL